MGGLLFRLQLALGLYQGPTCHQAGGAVLGLEVVQGPLRIPDVAFRGLPRFSQEALVCCYTSLRSGPKQKNVTEGL